jgi:hypothetical protein
MSQYERRRRGNALPGGLRGHPRRGNTSRGQRGSRHLAGIGAAPVGTLSPIQPVRVCVRVEPSSKPERSGVYAGQSLSFGLSGKARWGQAKVANRTREIRPSGMKTGARGNVAHGGTVNPPRNRKGGDGNPPPTSARAPVLSRPVYWRRTRKGRWVVALKTRKARLQRALQAVGEFCRCHRHDPLKMQHAALTRRLVGHFNYFGVNGNSRSLSMLVCFAERQWHKWLNRRSQRRRLNWRRFNDFLKVFPLPRPTIRVRIWDAAP